jgi:ribonucleoside-diphosphate reductase alpha chain
LGSINLEKFVRVGDGARLYIDWERLGAAARLTTRLLDNVVDANKFPDQQLHDMAHATRKIGLGIMGFARLLFLLQIPYGSEESCRLAGNLMSYIDWHSKAESIQLARERGAFPATKFHEDESYAIYESWFKERDAHSYRHADVCYHDLLRPLGLYGIRNSTTTTIAPTGTISIIADASSGCEPVFALAFKRWQADMHMVDVDPVFKAALKATEWPEAEQQGVLLSIDAHHGSLTEALNDGAFAGWNYDIHDELRGMADVFRTAHDVTPVQHINIQAAFQAFNDSATSKTINFPASATIEQVMESYSLAWSTGCKGVTIYRDGSREFQPLSTTVPQATAAVTTAAAELPELRQLGDVCAECGSCYRCGETCDCETKETINANA